MELPAKLYLVVKDFGPIRTTPFTTGGIGSGDATTDRDCAYDEYVGSELPCRVLELHAPSMTMRDITREMAIEARRIADISDIELSDRVLADLFEPRHAIAAE